MFKLTIVLFCLVQAAFGFSFFQRQAKPETRRQYQVAPAPTAAPIAKRQSNPGNYINDNDWSDFDFNKLTNLGLTSLFELNRQLKTLLPADGNVVTDNGYGPVVNTKFGDFPLPSYSMVPAGFREEFLPILKALVAVFEKDELNPAEANLLLSLSRDLTNKLPTPPNGAIRNIGTPVSTY